ncbi:SDR family oxidoreductase [Candidatus Methylopumilus turicensis]|uniref:Short-chain dehydrogenase/reductase SDR n=1 Tax=Candidatus Methylopumilus turicensis TaxID=1581680 RepID=A0A0B7ISR2_9PROT|nr:SDR family oxidoreductase [Candidatus Methylopumilus turicensis]CEN55384.1 Short-chain dehydrogenase/reductase SDR [Candidatus Methylopumilus turicensis]
MAHTLFITGANRGLGLEFVRQYAIDGWQVIASCRNSDEAHALQSLKTSYANISIIKLDVANFDEIHQVADSLKHVTIDLLINNAGIYLDRATDQMNVDDWVQTFKVNSIAPVILLNAFKNHLANSTLKKAVTLSSKMGSIDDNTKGGSYLYRSSKAAVNMAIKTASIDLKHLGISVATLHPGWVQTDMGGPDGLIDIPTSVNGLRLVIDNLSLANTGRFIDYQGKSIAW